jgi:hypothetical protein
VSWSLTPDERKAIEPRGRPIRLAAKRRREWLEGALPVRWFKKYGGEVFTVRDLYRAAVTQKQYGFAEWALAVALRKRGYGSILKCTARNDPEKVKQLKRVLSRRQATWLCRRGHPSAPPDLLVISRSKKKALFFAEAKLGRDQLRANQRRHFSEIYRKLKLRTRIYNVVCPYR